MSSTVTGPFDSVRDYMEALEARGHVVRVPHANQDEYESTAFAYRLMDKIGFNNAPAFILESTTIKGRVYNPVIGNVYGPLVSEAPGFGVEDLTDDHMDMYEVALAAVRAKGSLRGWNYLMALKRRGEKIARASIVFGADPIVFAMSSSKFAPLQGQDELGYAGCLRGRPVEAVKPELSDIIVPAHSEIVTEGEIPLDDMESEGPYGEFYGYMGPHRPENFYMNVKAITHRENPGGSMFIAALRVAFIWLSWKQARRLVSRWARQVLLTCISRTTPLAS